MKILKFGGSSVGSPMRIRNVIRIIKDAYDKDPQIGIVVSAFGGSTDQLISMGRHAASGGAYQNDLKAFFARHEEACAALILNGKCSLENEFRELKNLLEGISLIRELSPKLLDHLMSFGERLSARIIAEAIRPLIPEAKFVDARELIKTDRQFGQATVDFRATNKNIQKLIAEFNNIPIIPGFIGSSYDDEIVTLGRGGSDYSAAIIGSALDAEVVEIWTDVSGMYSADPRKASGAFPIGELSYKEAMEMSHFGAKVLHPPSLAPVRQKKIPIRIKNTFDPDAPGTFICAEAKKCEFPIRGISSTDSISLICLQGAGMAGVSGIAKRLFDSLAEKKISIILISQGSSEHSICLAIASSSVALAKEAIEKEFSLELKAEVLDPISIQEGFSVIAVVGANMQDQPGIAGRLFDALGKRGINLFAIAQGSSDCNISAVIKKEQELEAIRSIHSAFFIPKEGLNVFLVGTGLIGSALLNKRGIHVVGLANSRQMLIRPKGIPLDAWKDLLADGEKMDLKSFVEQMKQIGNAVFVDCTSSQEVADFYEEILKANIPIVAANKKANSGRYEYYRNLQKIAEQKNVKFLYGSNVGAGLPMIAAIRDQVQCGDRIKKIEAVLSGSLSHILNAVAEGKSGSEAVDEAKERGYTEPDPREDLSGRDVARKLLILCREAGIPLEMEEISLEPLSPEELRSPKNGRKLQYIASFKDGIANVSLQEVGEDHPFYPLSGNDNILAIYSDIYSKNPLVIQGPGAGAEVTAGRVLSEIMQIARSK